MDNVEEWTYLPIPQYSDWPPVEKTGRGSLLNRLSSLPSAPPSPPTPTPTTQSVKGLNCTDITGRCDHYRVRVRQDVAEEMGDHSSGRYAQCDQEEKFQKSGYADL